MLFTLLGLATYSVANDTAETPSIFVQDPEYFHHRQADLKMMQVSMEFANNSFDSLLIEADRIAKMSDQCAIVSINDVMDESCWTFYKVDLPAFEEHYAKVTGEVRLGYMETVRGLQDRKLQIEGCVTSLKSFVSSREENLFLNGGVYLEPLAKGFEANYDFTLQYEPNRRERTMEIAKVWGETCKDMVLRQDGSSFAPYFVSRLDSLNQELQEKGSSAVIKLDSSSTLTVYVDIAKSIRSAYYLNGIKLFHTKIASRNAQNSNLKISFTKDGVIADGESEVRALDGTPLLFKGRVQYDNDIAKVDGRWFWENRGKHEDVDFGPEFDEDSLATAKANAIKDQQTAEEKAQEESRIAAEKRRGIKPSFWAGFTGGGIFYTDNSVCKFIGIKSRDCEDFKEDSYTFGMFDIAAAARIKLYFGKEANVFVSAGVGAAFATMVYDGERKKTYLAPLGQIEMGYENFGIRETMIFPVESKDDPWTQFRTGGFYNIGLFSVELGYTIMMNAGGGFFASFGITL